MIHKNIHSKITALLLFSFAIIFIAAGCGKTGADASAGGSQNTVNSVSLSWAAPTVNSDGTPIAGDLAGYIIYYGKNSGNYTSSVDIGNFTSAALSDLATGNWCFSVTAYDTSGNESDLSDEICKSIS
jgi:hypothetical protein